MKAISANLKALKNSREGSRPWVWLFELERDASNISRWAWCQIDVTFDGQTYTHREIGYEPPEEDIIGTLHNCTLTVGDSDELIKAYLLAGKYLGRMFAVRLVNLAYLSAAADQILFRGKIISAEANEKAVAFQLGGNDLREAVVPRETISRSRCRFRWKDWRCGYTGGVSAQCDLLEETCSDRYSNGERFGGAPGIPGFRP